MGVHGIIEYLDFKAPIAANFGRGGHRIWSGNSSISEMRMSLILLNAASARLSSVSKRSSYAVSSILLPLLLANLCHLLCELVISCGYLSTFVIGKNALTLCGCFHRTDGMGYLGIKDFDFLSVCTLYRCCNLLRNVRAGHYHRH